MSTAPDLTVVIPALNEEEGLLEVLDGILATLKTAGISHELIVVDDGSVDRTGEIAASREVKVLRHSQSMGYGASLLHGIREAKAERILIMDADATYDPKEIPSLLRETTRDHVMVGVRTMSEGLFKTLLRAAFRGLVCIAAGRWIVDVNSGFRSFPRSLVLDHAGAFPSGFSFTTTLTLISAWKRSPVREVPIRYGTRKGRSKLRMGRDGMLALRSVLRTTARYRPVRLGLVLLLPAVALLVSWGGVLLISKHLG